MSEPQPKHLAAVAEHSGLPLEWLLCGKTSDVKLLVAYHMPELDGEKTTAQDWVYQGVIQSLELSLLLRQHDAGGYGGDFIEACEWGYYIANKKASRCEDVCEGWKLRSGSVEAAIEDRATPLMPQPMDLKQSSGKHAIKDAYEAMVRNLIKPDKFPAVATNNGDMVKPHPKAGLTQAQLLIYNRCSEIIRTCQKHIDDAIRDPEWAEAFQKSELERSCPSDVKNGA